jgi:UDP-N-acetylmuramoyl-L-alanyl-D-glutamate--2,6-diaminopimelate ligase
VRLGNLRGLEISWEDIEKGLKAIQKIPGRMECLQSTPYTVFVDYAHEEKSMFFIMETAQKIRKEGKKIIVLLGAEGGGRDPSKREKMGKIVGKMADIVVVSNVDPYSDDPASIAEGIAFAAQEEGKIMEKDLFVVLDRRSGIHKALSIAREGDIVFITGKGSEQSIAIDGISSPWDDRIVVAEELQKILPDHSS